MVGRQFPWTVNRAPAAVGADQGASVRLGGEFYSVLERVLGAQRSPLSLVSDPASSSCRTRTEVLLACLD